MHTVAVAFGLNFVFYYCYWFRPVCQPMGHGHVSGHPLHAGFWLITILYIGARLYGSSLLAIYTALFVPLSLALHTIGAQAQLMMARYLRCI